MSRVPDHCIRITAFGERKNGSTPYLSFLITKAAAKEIGELTLVRLTCDQTKELGRVERVFREEGGTDCHEVAVRYPISSGQALRIDVGEQDGDSLIEAWP